MFPFLSIMQHYVEFNICMIKMLEKLLGMGSFYGSFDHLVHYQTTFPTSSNGLGLPFVIQIVIPTFLGC